MSIEAPSALTLRDMVDEASGRIRIINECDEVLLHCETDPDLCSLSDVFNDKLLDRKVIRFWIDGDALAIKITGMEDAK